jgi:3-(3-hydroxy-phenyl)propionate hydroxylase
VGGAGGLASHVDYQSQRFSFRRSADHDTAASARHPVVIVGAGPVGMTLALDLAQRGVRVVLLDDDDKLSAGSRAICFAKRTLEIFDRLGVGDAMVAKGVSWNVGKVFLQDELVYSFDLLGEKGHRRPAFINLQQYYVEGFLADAIATHANIDMRWKHRVLAVDNRVEGAQVTVETPDGRYSLITDYLVACDGSRSVVRKALGLESKGQSFRDHFLIADVKMTAPFPSERWFWFDPPFHPNQSVLLHRQPDNVWRIDFQLGWDADPEEEKRAERVRPRVQALLGPDAEFEFEWISVYTFACMRMERFRHGRVLFAGDAAHLVSPFGARGANSGVQDADNLGWKLAFVTQGRAADRLLDTYACEREYAADENILNSTRSTDFITPKSEISRLFRDAVLELAKAHPFARRIVNSGRLSMPCTYSDSTLNTPDRDVFAGGIVPGAPAADAPVIVDGRSDWFLNMLDREFTLVRASDTMPLVLTITGVQPGALHGDSNPGRTVVASSEWFARYDAQPGTSYLFRPDQHVCARWRSYDQSAVRAALDRALCAV